MRPWVFGRSPRSSWRAAANCGCLGYRLSLTCVLAGGLAPTQAFAGRVGRATPSPRCWQALAYPKGRGSKHHCSLALPFSLPDFGGLGGHCKGIALSPDSPSMLFVRRAVQSSVSSGHIEITPRGLAAGTTQWWAGRFARCQRPTSQSKPKFPSPMHRYCCQRYRPLNHRR
jgi:hypothetical protein